MAAKRFGIVGPEARKWQFGAPAPNGVLPPAEVVESVIVDAEVMGDFVHDGGDHFVDDVFFGVTDLADRQPVDEDAIR